jgi:hypothetical protein
MAAMMKLKVMAGPVYAAATVPVMEKRPAPMMAPTPKAINPHGPSTLFRVLLPDSLASASRAVNVFLINNPIFQMCFSDKCPQIYLIGIIVANDFVIFGKLKRPRLRPLGYSRYFVIFPLS